LNRLEEYRATGAEQARSLDLIRLLPEGRRSVLDIGARDGHFSRLLSERFPAVTALDLRKPEFDYPGVVTIAGDATNLDFPSDSFDCVFCAEVLEHIPDIRRACREIARVAKHEIIIGVPFEQETRLGRTTCPACGKINPPWGHVNTFTESRLASLFPELQIISRSFIGRTREATNSVSTLLMDLGSNPWGTYYQDEPCIQCGAELVAPANRSRWQKICSAVAVRLNQAQARMAREHATWIHVVFSKTGRC
jgi:hypothetical protein